MPEAHSKIDSATSSFSDEKEKVVVAWIQKTLLPKSTAPGSKRKPILIGLNGPQGSGKTTLTRAVCNLCKEVGIAAIGISIDDFYLTHEEQVRLALKFPHFPTLQARGYPGTHDIPLGVSTIQALMEINQSDRPVLCPSYVKSLFNGEGDRAPKAEWKTVSPPLDLMILEGWMIGFRPKADLESESPEWKQINQNLVEYQLWQKELDAWIQIEPPTLDGFVSWRIEAEEQLRAQGRGAQSPAAIKAYAERFLPAYQKYLPDLLQNPPEQVPKSHCITLSINAQRQLIRTTRFKG